MHYRPLGELTSIEKPLWLDEKAGRDNAKRRNLAHIDQLSTATLVTMDIFQRNAWILRNTERDVHSPLLIVDESDLCLVGVTLRLAFSRAQTITPNLGEIIGLQPEGRMRSIKSMSAYLFSLPFDQDQALGVPVANAETSERARPLKHIHIHPERAMAYVDSSKNDLDIISETETQAVTEYSQVVQSVLDSMIVSKAQTATGFTYLELYNR